MHLRRPMKALITVMMTLTFLYISTAGALAATTLIVNGNSVNLRAGAGTNYKVVGGMAKGEKVTLVASKPGWLQVKTSKGVLGWASSMFLGPAPSTTTTPPASTTPTANVTKVQVTGSTVNLRSGPGTNTAVVGSTKKGDLLTWKKTLSGWYEVVTSAGKTAYISSTLSVLKPAAATTTPPASTTPTTTVAKVQVTGSTVNLRSGPGTNTAVVGSTKKGDLLTWKKTLSGWYEVLTSAGKTAYISSTLSVLKPAAVATTPPASTTPTTPTVPAATGDQAGKLQVTGTTVNLRSGPGTSYTVVGQVKKDQVLYAAGEQDGWYKVAMAGDEQGWIIGSLVHMLTPLASGGSTSTPSRGDDRPDLKQLSTNSGEDALGDFLSLTAEAGVEPTVVKEGNVAIVVFPNCQLGTAGIPTRVNIMEDKSLGFDITAASQEANLQVKVTLPAGLQYDIEQTGSRVTIRVKPQIISLLPVAVANGREAVEMRTTKSITVQAGSTDGTYWNISGLTLNQAVQYTGGSAYGRIKIDPVNSGNAAATIELRGGNLCDLIKIQNDVYRFYFRPIPQAGQPATIMIDPGHGGSDPGAGYFNANEKDFTLAMGLKLGQVLTESGYHVLYTRTTDTAVALNDRVSLANIEKPDLFVSVHCNANTSPTVNGTTTYYWPGDDPYLADQRKKLATALQQSLISRLGTTDKGVRTAEFVVVKYTNMPGALVETLFLSNQQDYQKLKDENFQWQIARAIADGITNYLNGTGIATPQIQSMIQEDKEATTHEQDQPTDEVYYPY